MATRTPTPAWFPVARSADVGTTPLPVGAAGQSWVVVRLRPGAEVSAFPARCPHRLVPLAAGTVVDGRLQCPYHGWRFDQEGRCVEIPSLGADGTPPPRADLTVPWAVEERDGWGWLGPGRRPPPPPPPPPRLALPGRRRPRSRCPRCRRRRVRSSATSTLLCSTPGTPW